LGVVAGAVYVYNSEQVPVSGRRRFNVIPPDWEREMGLSAYASLMKQEEGNILPSYDASVIRVKRVLSRLVAGLENLERADEKMTGEHEEMVVQGGEGGSLDDWEVNVIQSKEINAFVLPG
jgi:metalloendopeptidase OMA1, mitochondrial